MFQHHEEPSSGLDSIVLDAIIENSTASIAYLDTNFTFIKVNSLYVKDSGFTKEELLGKNHFALFPDAENLFSSRRNLLLFLLNRRGVRPIGIGS